MKRVVAGLFVVLALVSGGCGKNTPKPSTKSTTSTSASAPAKGAYCPKDQEGKTQKAPDGTKLTCKKASDGRDRWEDK